MEFRVFFFSENGSERNSEVFSSENGLERNSKVLSFKNGLERNSKGFFLPRNGSERNSEVFLSAKHAEFRRNSRLFRFVSYSAEYFFVGKWQPYKF
jgi:hypothetical protein